MQRCGILCSRAARRCREGPLSHGLKIASWTMAIAIVVLCDGFFLLCLLMTIAEELLGSGASPLNNAIVDIIFPLIGGLVPLLLIANLVLGIVALRSEAGGTQSTVRAIMLFLKIGLVPFFACGAVLEAVLIVVGFFPLFPIAGWVAAVLIGCMGWTVMLSGSIWAIALAVRLFRTRSISGGMLALHIALQLIFVADVVDGIVLFALTKDGPRAVS